MGLEEPTLDGLAFALGEGMTVVGGSSAAEEAAHAQAVPTRWQLSSMPPDATPLGAAFVLCWPSVVVAAAFSSGFEPAGPSLSPSLSGVVGSVAYVGVELEPPVTDQPARLLKLS